MLFIFTVNEITQSCIACHTKLTLIDVLAECDTCTDCLLSTSRCYKRRRSDDDVESPSPKRSEFDELSPSLFDDIMDLQQNPPNSVVSPPLYSGLDEIPSSLFDIIMDLEENPRIVDVPSPVNSEFEDVEPASPESADLDAIQPSSLDQQPTDRPTTTQSPPTKLCLFCGAELASSTQMFLCEHCHKTGLLF